MRPVAGPHDDPELLDVHVHELARVAAFVAVGRAGGLAAGQASLAGASEHGRDGGDGHAQRLADLGGRHAQGAQAEDGAHPLGRRASGHAVGRRRAILEPRRSLPAVAGEPHVAPALAHAGGRGRRRERPSLLDHPPAHEQPGPGRRGGVSVELHPGLPEVEVASRQPQSSSEARMTNAPGNHS